MIQAKTKDDPKGFMHTGLTSSTRGIIPVPRSPVNALTFKTITNDKDLGKNVQKNTAYVAKYASMNHAKNTHDSETINSADHACDNDDIVMTQSYVDHTMIENTWLHCEKIGEISKNSVGHTDSETQKPLCPVERTSAGNEFN